MTFVCTVASLKVPAVIVYKVPTKVLDTEIFPQYKIAGLISGITFILLFQSGEAFTVKGNKHTYTHTHTHTHTSTPSIETHLDAVRGLI